MNSGFCSMSFTAVDQLRAHFLTVSLKGHSQAREGSGETMRLPLFTDTQPSLAPQTLTDPA